MAVILKEVDKIRSELGLKLLPPTADGREDDTEVQFFFELSVSYSINRCSLASLDTISAIKIIEIAINMRLCGLSASLFS